MQARKETVVMVGACGMGMAPLAIFLKERGMNVVGWDDHPSERVVDLLKKHGIAMLREERLPEDCTKLVYSTAIGVDHELRAQARELGILQVRRGEMLAAQASQFRFVAIAGSHGKTTTTGMLIHALRKVKFPSGGILGGLFADKSAPANLGTNDWLVAEVDESDGTIEHFSPEITIVPNLDWDHADHYRRPAEIEAAFGRLFRRTRGCVFLPKDDAVLQRLAEENPGPCYLHFGPGCEYDGELLRQEGTMQTLRLSREFPEGEASVRAIGEFNAANATAALAVTRYLVGRDFAHNLLSDYPGVRRRQMRLMQHSGLDVYQDYAHHPSEIEPLMRALRQSHPDRQLVVVFQPHRYSRTAQFKAQFARVLERADRVYLLDVYAASERPVPGGLSSDLLAQFKQEFPVKLAGTRAELASELSEVRRPAVIAFVGAGDIEDWAEQFVDNASRRKGRKEPTQTMSQPSVFELLRSRVSGATPILENEPLGRRTTMGVGGPARFYAEPATMADLQGLLSGAKESGLEIFVMGRGSNLLVLDAGFPGLVIRLSSEAFCSVKPLDNGRLAVGAGARLKQLCSDAARLGLTGFEPFEGIPATVGGALRMNAGAMGAWLYEVVESVDLITPEGVVETRPVGKLTIGYRECAELRDNVAVGAIFKAKGFEDPASVRARMDAYASTRKASQPREPSAGCVFKNPDGDYAGRLIDTAALKGLRIGGAEISEVHGNFIVNRGGATSEDVLALIRKIRSVVREKHGTELEPEVQVLGSKWEELL
ncbi:MAG TPA: UDP-N-acetylmuramate dehydrogenase [Opitutales bacterium]|nr:UDP-N-acetylmuramate dehydrogenase [Opitutales bacterium]